MSYSLNGPWVRFQVPSELKNQEYERWLRTTFAEFLTYADRDNVFNGSHRLATINKEGRSPPFSVNGVDVGYWKVTLYDHRCFSGEWQGFLFWDHARHADRIAKLKLFADKFEEFLKSKGIEYDVYIREGGGEVKVSEP